MLQKTIAKEAIAEGLGIHYGKTVKLALKPAKENTGIVFIFPDQTEIKLCHPNVLGNSRGTVLSDGIRECFVIEHLLATIFALDIANLYIVFQESEIKKLELPIFDGSAKKWLEIFWVSGIKEQKELRQDFVFEQYFDLAEDDKYIRFEPIKQDFIVECLIDFPIIGQQSFVFQKNKTDFAKELAFARTFGFEYELSSLKNMGLAQGASLKNAILIKNNGQFSSKLYFENELARHKMLDLLGDLFTLGGFIKTGYIKAYKPGHKLNINFIKGLINN